MNREYRRTIIAGNWKMNLLASDVRAYADELRPLIPGFDQWCSAVVCAPFTSLPAAVQAFEGSGVGIGAQNMRQHDAGAYTGEVSGAQLRDIGAEYVIIGHSERRGYYGETDDIVNKKVLAALKNSLTPIICVGESLQQREMQVTLELVAMQVKSALYGVDVESARNIAIAYEPIWAIGTGVTAKPIDAQIVCHEIRSVLSGMYNAGLGECIPLLYGGSMNEQNAHELLAQIDVDGGLIGGASLKPKSFAAIVNAANQ